MMNRLVLPLPVTLSLSKRGGDDIVGPETGQAGRNINPSRFDRLSVTGGDKSIYVGFLILLTALLLLLRPCHSAEPERVSLEARTKAVFMYHFSSYIEWPQPDTSESFNILLLGKTDIEAPLREIEGKQTVSGKPIKVFRAAAMPDTLRCHILFVPESVKPRLADILRQAENKNILTIGDTEGFGEAGTAVNFVIRDGRVRFEINTRSMGSTGLKVSSQLLKLAIFVGEEAH